MVVSLDLGDLKLFIINSSELDLQRMNFAPRSIQGPVQYKEVHELNL